MRKESLQNFYKRTKQALPEELRNGTSMSHFNVRPRSYIQGVAPYNRRDYFKICLVLGKGVYRVGKEAIAVNEPSIIFSNPDVAASWESLSPDQGGYYCLFNEAFIQNSIKEEVKYGSALFNKGVAPLLTLDFSDTKRFMQYFTDMERWINTSYSFRFDMIRHVINLLIYEAVTLQQPPLPIDSTNKGTVDRLVKAFLHLLDQQFPVDSPENPLRLSTPSDYSERLNIHVNHLNAVVKRATGKTSRQMIADRIMKEAKKMLLHTDWDASQIAYSLGFEYPSHFNKYFKKHADMPPLTFRQLHS
ncbi:MAG TPA: helix-turn-helix domain-containing protein [Pseudosphingobacterium sp.]|nr:helix-turn-helix domain-containing protein [Pseudosphingobacterium sp.]